MEENYDELGTLVSPMTLSDAREVSGIGRGDEYDGSDLPI